MAIEDFVVFVQERVANFDSAVDTSPGSPFYEKVIQKIVDRVGTDPFTIDTQTFIRTTLAQGFPTLAIGRGDAFTDILINGASLLFDPLVRETKRIALQQSLGRADLLTTDEVTALGANFFEPINTGTKSRVTARIFFAQPRQVRVNQTNYTYTSSNLRFFPNGGQSITANEMLLNREGSSYYFDVQCIAEEAGSAYEIDRDNLVGISGVLAAVRVSNPAKASVGLDAETPEQYAQRLESSQSDRSLVTVRGILRVLSQLSDVSRVAVSGYGDPEMGRDIIYGGGLATPEVFGVQARPIPDGVFNALTRRVLLNDFADLFSLVGGSLDDVDGWSLTLVNAFGGVGAPIRDLKVTAVINANTLEVEDQVMVQTIPQTNYIWALRRNGITISKIPGGIVNPDGPNGTVLVKKDQVHIGGVYDVFLRGSSFAEATLRIDTLLDDGAEDRGIDAAMSVIYGVDKIYLEDRQLDEDYVSTSATFKMFEQAQDEGWSIVIDEGPVAGAYLILSVLQTSNKAVQLTVYPSVNPALINPMLIGLRWRLTKEITVDLNAPKLTKVLGENLSTTQGSVLVEDANLVDLLAFGASEGDTLEVLGGYNKGLYTLAAVPIPPFYNRVQLTTPMPRTASGVAYKIYRSNADGGINLPFVRMRDIDLLDTSGGAVGTKIPYAKALNAYSSSFSNLQAGLKAEAFSAVLGIVSDPIVDVTALGGLTLSFYVEGVLAYAVVLLNTNSLNAIANQLNAVAGKVIVNIIANNRLGFTPIGPSTDVAISSTVADGLHFGGKGGSSSRYVRAEEFEDAGGLDQLLVPILASVDVLQVVTGSQVGFYGGTQVESSDRIRVDRDFFPELNAHVLVGSKSLGSARLYFLEPTTVLFNENSVFKAQTPLGEFEYYPDPTLEGKVIPAPPAEATPNDGFVETIVPGSVQLTSSIDFRRRRVRVGDVLAITYKKLTGSQALTDPVANFVGKRIKLSFDGSNDRSIIFVNDSSSIPSDAVTRAGVASQINQALGTTVAKIVQIGPDYFLQFDIDKSIRIRLDGTANVSTGFSTTDTTTNDAVTRGRYPITAVSSDQAGGIQFEGFGLSETDVYFEVYRTGEQRFTATAMSKNVDPLGFYYIDVELISAGTGDAWNIEAGTPFKVEGYRSDGYYLTSVEPETSFSTQEKLVLHVAPTLLDLGNNDSEESRTQLSGQSVQINYDTAPVVATAQSLLSSELERTVNANPLARHLYPHFLRTSINYAGGSQPGVILPELKRYVLEVYPAVPIDGAELLRRVQAKGSSFLQTPLEIAAVVHNEDRTVTLERSEGTLGTTRFASYWPESIKLNRSV